MQTRTLLLALRTGEPSRIARALALEAGFVATVGPKNHRRAERLIAASGALAEKLGDPYSRGWVRFQAGAVAYFEGRFKDCFESTEEVYQLFARCSGVSWERTTVRHYGIWALIWLGSMRQAIDRVKAQLKAAMERGDLYSAADLRLFTSNMAWLAEDDVPGARLAVDEAMALWSKQGFHVQHYYAFYARGQIDLYESAGVDALRSVEASWPALRASMLLEVQSIRVESLHLRARCALAAAREDSSHLEQYLRSAESDARRLRRETSVFAPAMGDLTLAAVDLMRGDVRGCSERLRAAIRGFESADMSMYASVAARRLAALSGADHDARHRGEAADECLQAEGIVDAERWTDLLAPGFEPSARRALTP